MLRLAAAILFIGGPLLGLIFWSWGLGAMVFGLGAIVLGIRQVQLGEHRSDRFLGVALLLGGTFTVIDGLIRLLSGASP
jgi:succinate-acetate transporter protein